MASAATIRPSPAESAARSLDAGMTDDFLLSVFRSLYARGFNSDVVNCSLVSKRWFFVQGFVWTRIRIIRSKALEFVVRRFPNLRELDFSGCFQVNDKLLVLVAKTYGAQLRKLNLFKNKMVTSAGLMALGEFCHSGLEELDLNFGTFGDDALMGISRCSNLKILDLTNCRYISDIGLCCIAASCKNLTWLSLRWCTGISESGMIVVCRNCSLLKHLDLSNLKHSKEALRHVSQLPHLESLLLSSSQNLNDEMVATLRYGCKNLRLLDVSVNVTLTEVSLMALAFHSSMPLEHFNMSYCPQVSDSVLVHLARFEKLLSLKFDHCAITDLELLQLLSLSSFSQQPTEERQRGASAPEENGRSQHAQANSGTDGTGGARSEVLSECLTDDAALENDDGTFMGEREEGGGENGRERERGGAEWRRADVKGSSQGDSSNASLLPPISIRSPFPLLEELCCKKCDGVTDEGLVGPIFSNCRFLKKADLTCCRELTDVSLIALAENCNFLTTLLMEGCQKMTPSGIRALAFSPCALTLEKVDFTDCGFSDEGLLALSSCHNLRSLKLGFDDKVTDEGLEHVGRKCSRLEEIDLYRCPSFTHEGLSSLLSSSLLSLTSLNASYCPGINDEALRCLSGCKNLRQLELRGCQAITGEGLICLAEGCTELRELDLKKCGRIGKEGLEAISRACKDLREITLSYTSVDDTSLFALASMNCIWKFNLVHCSKLSAQGIARALLACEGLKKVKLLNKWKAEIPDAVWTKIDARGCCLRFMDKPNPPKDTN